MADKHAATTTSRMPGNDGRWFLKAAGVDTAATELGDVALDAESTSELVRELWAADAGPEDLSSLSPQALSKTVQRRRNFRWPMVAVALLIIGLVAGALLWLPGTSTARASEVATGYQLAYAALYEDLAPAQQVLATLTDPTAEAADQGEGSAVITQLRTHAGDALVLATTPIPRPYPLAPDEPFTRLAPHRDTLSVQGTAAEAVARRLEDLLDYRVAAERLFAIDELPTRPSRTDVNALTEELAQVAGDSATALDELPEDAAYAEHKAAVREAMTRFTDWQVEYAEAMRLGRRRLAETLVAEWESISAELDALLVSALARVRTEVDSEIVELATSIDQSLTNLEGS
jgi:hypothetical protein